MTIWCAGHPEPRRDNRRGCGAFWNRWAPLKSSAQWALRKLLRLKAAMSLPSSDLNCNLLSATKNFTEYVSRFGQFVRPESLRIGVPVPCAHLGLG